MLTVQLVVPPLALLARRSGLARWRVQLDLNNKHAQTQRIRGCRAAGELRDRLVAQIRTRELTIDSINHPTTTTRAADPNSPTSSHNTDPVSDGG